MASMRPLNAKQAFECETATHPRCRCRCGGELHGANRLETANAAHDLDRHDPHYSPIPGCGRQLSLEIDLAADRRLDVPRSRSTRAAWCATPPESLLTPSRDLSEHLRLAV
jgi:hypothetical protein